MKLIDLARRHAKSFGGITPAIWAVAELAETSYERVVAGTQDASRDVVARASELAKRYQRGEPLQYLLGHWAFRELDLVTDPRALIPRPETEMLVDIALELLDGVDGAVAADLGTGTGAVGISLAVSGRFSLVYMTDASAEALSLASQNVQRNIRLVKGAVFLSRGSWFAALPDSCRGRLDLVASNPPYIPSAAIAGLDDRVLYEPRSALDGGPSGMNCLFQILSGAPDYLRHGGSVVLEMGEDQGGVLAEVASSFGYEQIAVRADQAGRPRFFTARWLG
ncbi:MAG: peptide chain release factor N(5)-glutamine methyltransferase [Actinomycetota bacterium]|nr:peptide chain release factor N(5)-glutamine methyltransferase [Actinomycetota bacterium]MDA8208528.1 peptide chain release factor N(5)-glutamine methyltransferase [Actinomycetota bacterium]